MLDSTYRDQVCSIARALEVVGERWTLLVMRDVLLGVRRFDALVESLGVTRTVLTHRLARLTDDGLLERRRYQVRPERFEYLPTAKGRALAPTLAALMHWGDTYYAGPAGPPRLLLHRGCGSELRESLICQGCGEAVGAGDIDAPLTADR